MKNHCNKMGRVPILSQRFFSHWRQLQRKSLILNSTIEILRTHKIAAILTVAVAHCERAPRREELSRSDCNCKLQNIKIDVMSARYIWSSAIIRGLKYRESYTL